MTIIKRIFSIILFVAVELVLLLLSNWQFDRLQQKEHAILLRDLRWSQPPQPIEIIFKNFSKDPTWYHVELCGMIDFTKIIKVVYNGGQGRAAFSLALPLQTSGRSFLNQNVILDAGYFYFDTETKFMESVSKIKTTKKQCVTGHVLPSYKESIWFNSDKKNAQVHYSFDSATISSQWGWGTDMPLIVRLDHGLPQLATHIHSYGNNRPEISNPHKNYAYTWLALAILWPVIIGLRIRKNHL